MKGSYVKSYIYASTRLAKWQFLKSNLMIELSCKYTQFDIVTGIVILMPVSSKNITLNDTILSKIKKN